MKAKNTLRCEHGKRHCSITRRLGGMNNKQAAVRLAMGCTPQRACMARINSVIILNSSSRLSEIRRAAVSTAVSIQCNMNCNTYARFLKRQRPRVAPLNFERGNEERDKSISNLPVCGYVHGRAWRCGSMNVSCFLLLPMRARPPPSHVKCMFDRPAMSNACLTAQPSQMHV